MYILQKNIIEILINTNIIFTSDIFFFHTSHVLHFMSCMLFSDTNFKLNFIMGKIICGGVSDGS